MSIHDAVRGKGEQSPGANASFFFGVSADAARKMALRYAADLVVEKGPQSRIRRGHASHVAVSSAIADFAQERAQGASAYIRIHVSVENLTEQFPDYRHRLSLRSEATDLASGGGTAFATCRCWSRSRTTPVRRRMGPTKTCPSGKP